MYALLELYARPLSRAEPVICIDEKSLQLIGHSRTPLPMTDSACAKHDYEYTRNGTTNLFVAVEPKAGQRIVSVTQHRGNFVAFVGELLTGVYTKVRRVHLVLDNLNTRCWRRQSSSSLGIFGSAADFAANRRVLHLRLAHRHHAPAGHAMPRTQNSGQARGYGALT